MDLCKMNADFAVRSNLMPFECHHLQSLTYCAPARTDTTTLKGDILNKMIHEKWFGKAKKEKCLQWQAEATNKGVPHWNKLLK